MSIEALPVVAIDRDGVRVEINESDLQATDVIWDDEPKKEPAKDEPTKPAKKPTKKELAAAEADAREEDKIRSKK